MRCSGSARAVSIRIGTRDSVLQRAGEVEAGLPRHHHVENEQVEGEAAHAARALAASIAVVTRKPLSCR